MAGILNVGRQYSSSALTGAITGEQNAMATANARRTIDQQRREAAWERGQAQDRSNRNLGSSIGMGIGALAGAYYGGGSGAAWGAAAGSALGNVFGGLF